MKRTYAKLVVAALLISVTATFLIAASLFLVNYRTRLELRERSARFIADMIDCQDLKSSMIHVEKLKGGALVKDAQLLNTTVKFPDDFADISMKSIPKGQIYFSHESLPRLPKFALVGTGCAAAPALLLEAQYPLVTGKMFMGRAAVALMIVGIILVAAVSLLLIYLRHKARTAEGVLKSMASGNLGARLPEEFFDNFSGLVSTFNRMADEIENLVRQQTVLRESRTEFLHELSHDIRTPVASLKAAADTLKEFGDKLPPEKVSALMTIIALESNYFKELVDNLFFLATLDSPKFTTDFEQFDLGEIISEEVALLRRKLDGKIALESRLETEVIHVRGHAIMLRRLLRNVLENAAKYGSTRVSLTVREDARSYILTVEDDGPGMTEDDLKKFGTKKISRKVSAVSPSEAVSLGIGSVIILEIAKFHDAELVVANVTLGKGVIVTLRLPK